MTSLSGSTGSRFLISWRSFQNIKNITDSGEIVNVIFGLFQFFSQKGKHSLDQISLYLFSWSKVSVKFGVWSNAFFVSWSNYFTCFQLIESFINVILSYFKLLINCQKRTYWFWHLIESSNNGVLGFSSTFDQVPKSVGSFWQLIECTVG